jgi:hypothetical protein
MKPIILRPARPEDMQFIRKFHSEQNERDGTAYPLVPFFNSDMTLSSRVPVALVGERGKEPVQALYVERIAELQFAGCDPKGTAFARRDIEALATVLYWQGYRSIHCFVPHAVADSIRKPLEKAGFVSKQNELEHFFREAK